MTGKVFLLFTSLLLLETACSIRGSPAMRLLGPKAQVNESGPNRDKHSVALSLIEKPQDIKVKEFWTVELPCRFDGNARGCMWTRNGLPIMPEGFPGVYDFVGRPENGDCSLRIVSAKHALDDGQWICQMPPTARVPQGIFSEPVSLVVESTSKCSEIDTLFLRLAEERQSKCGSTILPKNSETICQSRNGAVICTATCWPGFLFADESTQAQRTCIESNGLWTPESPLEDCHKDESLESLCAVWSGGRHLATFDGRIRRSSSANCRYTLVSDACHDGVQHPTFQVQIVTPSSACDSSVRRCRSVVHVRSEDNSYVLKWEGDEPGFYWRNRSTADNNLDLPVHGSINDLSVTETTHSLRVRSRRGFSVSVNAAGSVSVRIDKSLEGKTCGLCGNLDDFRGVTTPEGRDVIGLAFPDDEWNAVFSEEGETCAGANNFKKQLEPAVMAAAERICARSLANRTTCNRAVDVGSYLDACAEDVAGCGSAECACPTLVAYLEQCALLLGEETTVAEEWRRDDVCRGVMSSTPIEKPLTNKTQVSPFQKTPTSPLGIKNVTSSSCDSPMGLESGSLGSDRMSASSEWSTGSGANRARLNFDAGWGGWFPRENTKSDFIQVDFKSVRTLSGIVTQGVANYQGWVTAYTVQSSDDGLTWNPVSNENNQHLFAGNSDNGTPVTRQFRSPIRARFIRVSPQAWKNWVSMRLEILGCVNGDSSGKGKCNEPMGLESGSVTSDQITASTSWDSQSGPDRCRLNYDVGWSGWFAKENAKSQFIQVDFGSRQTLTGVVTQGIANYQGWVTSYTVQSSDDGLTWNIVTNENNQQVFAGNSDNNTPVKNRFALPITARFFRVSPQAWKNWVGLRMEFLGCAPGVTPSSCNAPMGLERGSLNSDRMSASTEWSIGSGANRARLNFNAGWGGWFAKENTKSDFIQVDFKSVRTLSGIVTQGIANYEGWVTSYTVQSSDDGLTWIPVSNTNNQQVFAGNSDKGTPVKRQFRSPIRARFIRVSPQAWKSWVGLRMEVLGCVDPSGNTARKCDEPMGLESGSVGSDQITASTSWDLRSGPDRARLNYDAGWSGWFAKENTKSEFMQVDFESVRTLSGIVTQGVDNYEGWVTSYTVQSSDDGLTWISVPNANNQLVFAGNSDNNTPVTRRFRSPIKARFLRVSPQAWKNWVGLRMEILGCF